MKRKAAAPQGPSLFDMTEPVEVAPGHLRAEVTFPVSYDPPTHPPCPEAVAREAAARRGQPAWRGEPGYVFKMSPAERAASEVDLPERSRWTFEGREVEVRGTSPLMVWFVPPGQPGTAQQTRYRHEFLKKAVRL